MNAIAHRYDFVVLFDVTNGNPNGDPDAGNQPRMDPETGHGLVTDVCLKRKIRNYIEVARAGEAGFQIYVREGAILNEQHRIAYLRIRDGDPKIATEKRLNPQNDAEADALRNFMCQNFFDIRTFGAVMSTGINCGQVRGPVQIAFGRSIEPIMPLEITVTRAASTTSRRLVSDSFDDSDSRFENRTMGRKYIVPYALYRSHGFVSASLAAKTGFSDDDLGLLWEAIIGMFDHDRTASRGEMALRKLIVFEHSNALGRAAAHDLFDRVSVRRTTVQGQTAGSDHRLEGDGPARRFSDYEVLIDQSDLPVGVTIRCLS